VEGKAQPVEGPDTVTMWAGLESRDDVTAYFPPAAALLPLRRP